jgi:hypothetical protein
VVSPILVVAVHPAGAVPATVGKVSQREILSGYFLFV